MRVHVLGSVAGGFPQWNCNCRNCASLRQGAVPQKSEPPPYSPHRHAPHRADTIGVRVEDINTRKNLFYAPGLGYIEPPLPRYLDEAGCLLVGGTVWTDDREAIQSLVADMPRPN